MARSRNIKNPLMAVNPSPIFHLLSISPFNSLLFSPKKNPRNPKKSSISTLSVFFIFLLTFFTFLGISIISFIPNFQNSSNSSPFSSLSPSSFSPLLLTSLSSVVSDDEPTLSNSVIMPLPVHLIGGNLSKEEREFWEQPYDEGYRPCLDFGIDYRKASVKISKEKRKFLVVMVSGGLNQQKNQIVDAVVIARILGAALVLPDLHANLIWEDESKFPDIFDVKHFKRTLQADVRIVSSLPSTYLISKQLIEAPIPYNVSPFLIRSRFLKQLNKEGFLVLKGLDSKLSKNLPSDLQKLRCKVAFHALRFAAPIQELGNKLARRMWIEGPYIALHLRLEKDVWVRTGCLTGLGSESDTIIRKIRESRPEYLTGRLNMTYYQRRVAGLCPLNALEMARLLKALGASRTARLYRAGGDPFGGTLALQPLIDEFPNLVSKEMLAHDSELAPYVNKASALAAIDYIVSLSSNVFIPSHGGNMGRALQGHRAYVGHRKYIMPNKRAMIPFFEDELISEAQFGRIIRKLHRKSQGQPELRTNKRDRDVIAHPAPECMCKHKYGSFLR